jgi:hypothetical protein
MTCTRREDYKLCAAIDFGTTFCGVMYSSKKDYDIKNPLRIFADRKNRDTATLSQEPTSILLNPNKSFRAFGMEAEDEYGKLATKQKHRDYYFFRRFKMTLHRDRVIILK